jgi:hypothetical protein
MFFAALKIEPQWVQTMRERLTRLVEALGRRLARKRKLPEEISRDVVETG